MDVREMTGNRRAAAVAAGGDVFIPGMRALMSSPKPYRPKPVVAPLKSLDTQAPQRSGDGYTTASPSHTPDVRRIGAEASTVNQHALSPAPTTKTLSTSPRCIAIKPQKCFAEKNATKSLKIRSASA